ncbi:hypothetical protein M8J77_000515 [Diaphorina citri]|nr:hypothetical protein M8J77_024172 [Diaphorina citri]KAI5727309.1 hypothetical protein M8J77_000515 [Diaphorina citri]
MSQTFSSVVSGVEDSNLRPRFNPSRRSEEKRPTKDQAIVLSTTETSGASSIPYYAFTRAVGEIVGPKNVTHASKIPGSKFCIFLSSAELAKKFQTEHPNIQVNEIQFNVSPYIQPAAKLVLCNVWPFLPNYIFEEALDKTLDRTIQFISPIRDVGMGFLDKEYNNVCFFKRYVFIQSTESKEIIVPDYIIVTYEGNPYKVYLEIENKCKFCHEPHPTNKCPTKHTPDLTLRLDKAKSTRENNQPINISNTPQETTINNEIQEQTDQEMQGVTPDEQDTTQLQSEPSESNNEAIVAEVMKSMLTPTQEETFCIPDAPLSENKRRLSEFSQQTNQPQPKKTPNTEEEEIYPIITDILKTEPLILIDPQELTRLWCEMKNAKNKLEIIKNYNFNNNDLITIFHALTNHPEASKKYKTRAKKITSILYAEESELSDKSSIASRHSQNE